jgi:hypothetical protein
MFEKYNSDKYSKPQKKPGPRLRLGSYGLPMLVVLLIASAFYAAHVRVHLSLCLAIQRAGDKQGPTLDATGPALCRA